VQPLFVADPGFDRLSQCLGAALRGHSRTRQNIVERSPPRPVAFDADVLRSVKAGGHKQRTRGKQNRKDALAGRESKLSKTNHAREAAPNTES